MNCPHQFHMLGHLFEQYVATGKLLCIVTDTPLSLGSASYTRAVVKPMRPFEPIPLETVRKIVDKSTELAVAAFTGSLQDAGNDEQTRVEAYACLRLGGGGLKVGKETGSVLSKMNDILEDYYKYKLDVSLLKCTFVETYVLTDLTFSEFNHNNVNEARMKTNDTTNARMCVLNAAICWTTSLSRTDPACNRGDTAFDIQGYDYNGQNARTGATCPGRALAFAAGHRGRIVAGPRETRPGGRRGIDDLLPLWTFAAGGQLQGAARKRSKRTKRRV